MTAAAAVPAGGDAAAAVDSLVALSLRRSPALRALAWGTDAAREQAPAAGALPDPMVGISSRGMDYPGGGIGSDPMAMAAVEVSQAFPWPGKQRRRQAAAEALVPVAAGRRETARRRLAADVRGWYADLFAVDASIRAAHEAITLLDLLAPDVASRYAHGEATQTDLIELQIERARLMSDVDDAMAERAETVSRLAAALDDPSAAQAVLAEGLPTLSDPSPAGVTGAAFGEVATAAAGVTAARLQREAAEREGSPDIVVGAEYGWRGTMSPMITARLGVELPLWQGRKQDAMARAAGHDEAQAQAEEREARAQADAEVSRLRARLAAAERSAARLRSEILPRVQLSSEGARARYIAGDARVEPWTSALRQLAAARADLARREADRYQVIARLLALSGLDPVAGAREGTE